MRTILIALLLMAIWSPVEAQHSFNFGLSYGRRLNYNHGYFHSVAGPTIEYQRSLNYSASLRIFTGLEGTDPGLAKLGPGDEVLYLNTYIAVPFRIGYQHFLIDDNFFVFAEPGIVISDFPMSDVAMPTRVNLSYALGAGYLLHFNKRSYLQATLSFNRNHYDDQFRFSWLSARLAYGRKGRK